MFTNNYTKKIIKQDGPSLESSSYLNVSLRYLGPWDPGTLGPLDLGTLGPWDSWTSSLLQHLLILPLTSSYLLLSLLPTLLLWNGLVWGGLSFDIGDFGFIVVIIEKVILPI